MAMGTGSPQSAPQDATKCPRRSISELRKECGLKGICTKGCVERAELEALLEKADTGRADSSPIQLAEAHAELESWVGYGPRALTLLTFLSSYDVTVSLLQQTKLGITVRRYAKHRDAAVASCASHLVDAWRGLVHNERPAPRQPPPPRVSAGATRSKGRGASRSSSSSSSSSSGDSSADVEHERAHDGAQAAPPAPAADVEACSGEGGADTAAASGWQRTTMLQTFRGKKERFHVFTLRRPFGAAKWAVRVRVAQGQHRPECQELLERMAVDFGAAAGASGQETEEDRQVLSRLQRLEERFRGSGVTEGEARNAMRLFERELSKANWTEEKFLKLKRQLAGTEEWSAADAVAESSLIWVKQIRRRQAWFADACSRVATPLGLEFGYCESGGCCFVGPLSAAAGAALTAALVSHLAGLDLERALHSKGRSKISAPQFLQGFVDGALDRDRHLVWEKLFSIEDAREAARFCEESRQRGFFDNTDDGVAESDQGAGDPDLHFMLRDLFSNQRGGGGVANGGSPRARCSSSGPSPAAPVAPAVPAAPGAPHEYTPFSGKGQRLDEEAEEGTSNSSKASGSKAQEQQSWALTFSSNLELVRSSRQRSRAQAQKSYHWTFSGHSVKPTQTGTESYSKGRQAGEKRKGEIDGAASSAKRKFRKKPLLAIGQ